MGTPIQNAYAQYNDVGYWDEGVLGQQAQWNPDRLNEAPANPYPTWLQPWMQTQNGDVVEPSQMMPGTYAAERPAWLDQAGVSTENYANWLQQQGQYGFAMPSGDVTHATQLNIERGQPGQISDAATVQRPGNLDAYGRVLGSQVSGNYNAPTNSYSYLPTSGLTPEQQAANAQINPFALRQEAFHNYAPKPDEGDGKDLMGSLKNAGLNFATGGLYGLAQAGMSVANGGSPLQFLSKDMGPASYMADIGNGTIGPQNTQIARSIITAASLNAAGGLQGAMYGPTQGIAPVTAAELAANAAMNPGGAAAQAIAQYGSAEAALAASLSTPATFAGSLGQAALSQGIKQAFNMGTNPLMDMLMGGGGQTSGTGPSNPYAAAGSGTGAAANTNPYSNDYESDLYDKFAARKLTPLTNPYGY